MLLVALHRVIFELRGIRDEAFYFFLYNRIGLRHYLTQFHLSRILLFARDIDEDPEYRVSSDLLAYSSE